MKKWTVAALGVALVALALPSVAAAQRCPLTSPGVAQQNAANRTQVNRLLHNPSYTPIIRTVRPDPTRFKGFDGFQTLKIRAPRGTSPVVGAYTSLPPSGGCELGAIQIQSARVVASQNSYVMKLKFPGSQGNPGRLRIVLISR